MRRLITLILFMIILSFILVMNACTVRIPTSLREAEKQRLTPNRKEKNYYHGTVVVYFGVTKHFKETQK